MGAKVQLTLVTPPERAAAAVELGEMHSFNVLPELKALVEAAAGTTTEAGKLPGTVLEQIRVPPPDRPSIVMQRDPKFIEIVLGLREKIDHLESSQRAGD